MIDDIRAIRDEALARVRAADSLSDLQEIDATFTAKSGRLTELKKRLGSLTDVEERKAAGRSLNEAVSEIEVALGERRSRLHADEVSRRVASERIDLTEYVNTPTRGHAHLVTQAWQRLEDVFIGLGFQVAEGPEVETDWYNFEALNMREGHPARGEFDTLFVDHAQEGAVPGRTVLRTHTSPVQIRTMLTSEPPIYVVAPGRVFRRDTPDATHMPVFHQIEGLVIDRDVSLADLSGTIEAFTRAFFGPGFSSRLRPSYFPFTEPSAEFDIQRPDGSWLELGGCGMVHPNVLRAGGLDPEEWSGFAFGFGIDRMAVMRHQVADLRDMYADDIRFIRQF